MDALRSAVEAHTGLRVARLEPLGGGACQELFRVDLDGPLSLVLRSDARNPLPGSLRRSQEYAVVQAARRAGVATPEPRWPAEGLVREGASAYFMDRVEGETLGGRVVRDPRLEEARRALPGQLAGELSRIHSVTPSREPALPLADPGGDPVGAALDFQRRALDGLPEARPALELAFRWLEEHRPPSGETVLVHGDFRTGNFVVGPGGLVAVLDWEFAHWGSPEEDLAWLCLRDWRFGALDRAAGGLVLREEFYRLYQEASGQAVDPGTVRWWEVFGNVRWAAGALAQSQRFLAGGEADLELLALGPRAAEMEFEALRLVAGGLPGPVPQAPAGVSLLPAAVARFLETQVRPRLTDRDLAFRLRIASHLLGLAAREAEAGEGLDRAEAASWARLLGLPEPSALEGPAARRRCLQELEGRLVERIRSGPTEGLAGPLLDTLAARLRVLNPAFDVEAPC